MTAVTIYPGRTVAGWFDALPELGGQPVPILYLEQGHTALFGDVTIQAAGEARARVWRGYRAPVALAAVSPLLADLLGARFGRRTGVVPPWVDTERFTPAASRRGGELPRVLLVGDPYLRFKGFQDALRALELAWRDGRRFEVLWVAQRPVDLKGLSSPVRFAVEPAQSELPGLYAGAALLVSASWYEGFGLPPMEAMAAGVPVVATRSGGWTATPSMTSAPCSAPPGMSPPWRSRSPRRWGTARCGGGWPAPAGRPPLGSARTPWAPRWRTPCSARRPRDATSPRGRRRDATPDLLPPSLGHPPVDGHA